MYTLKVYKLHIEEISILYKDVAFKDTSYVVWNNLISKIELSTSEEYVLHDRNESRSFSSNVLIVF